jgi:hypothetical protein
VEVEGSCHLEEDQTKIYAEMKCLYSSDLPSLQDCMIHFLSQLQGFRKKYGFPRDFSIEPANLGRNE